MTYKDAIIAMINDIKDEVKIEQIYGYVSVKWLKDRDKKDELSGKAEKA